jgi:hypothetical protein
VLELLLELSPAELEVVSPVLSVLDPDDSVELPVASVPLAADDVLASTSALALRRAAEAVSAGS